MEGLASILSTDGLLIISVPTVSSDAWTEYREHWVQADAPRHLVLHSVESFRMLTEAHGFVVESLTFNSDAFQFYGSELYRRDIPLSAYEKMPKKERKAMFSPSDMREFTARAEALNTKQRGDQFTAVLKKK